MVEVDEDTVSVEPVDFPLSCIFTRVGVVEPNTRPLPVLERNLVLVLVGD